MGLQYHFTMEPQTTVAIPFEDGLKIFSATQWMDQTQSVIAHMLQVKAKDVQLQVCVISELSSPESNSKSIIFRFVDWEVAMDQRSPEVTRWPVQLHWLLTS